MRVRRPQRGTIALLGALAAIAAVLGFAATPAHALTATDKGAIYKYCRAEGYSRTYCCKAAGGYWSSASSTCEFVDDPMDLQITLRLNGRVMQDESTKDMIFDVAQLVAYCSQVATLLPGDLLLTGSPAGNGMHWGRLLRPGDVMEAEISGLGMQRNGCITEGAWR